MKIESTRFGSVEIRDDAVIDFPEGIIGLPGTRYALIAQGEGAAFYWLHSVEDASVALPVTSPWLFFSDYEVQVSDDDAAGLALRSSHDATIFCVVRASERIEDFTVNLRGPIVINSEARLGRQVINEIGSYDVRQPLFARVELSQIRPAEPQVPVAATAS